MYKGMEPHRATPESAPTYSGRVHMKDGSVLDAGAYPNHGQALLAAHHAVRSLGGPAAVAAAGAAAQEHRMRFGSDREREQVRAEGRANGTMQDGRAGTGAGLVLTRHD
jgi:hypothetical protein